VLVIKIKKPIFIIGVGRSGSSIFHKIFSEHPQVAWLSNFCNKYPNNLSINRFILKLIDYPIVGKYVRRKINPSEAYDFWEYHCKGFRHPCRDLLSQDVTIKTKERIKDVFSKILTNKRNRLLIKITGWPRIGFLHDVFDDAKFIHIIRDGRAVANSLINENWWWGWRGPQNWRWGELTHALKEEWDKYNKSFIVLAAIEWKILIKAVLETKRILKKENFLEVKYEDLCSDALSVLKNVIEFSELEWSREFEESVRKYKLKNTNYKWKRELTYHQQNSIEEVLKDYLKEYNY